MAEFRSSARTTGFNAINLPDNARRIQEAGEKRVRDLRRVYEQSIEQREDFLNAAKSSADAVQQQLNRNEQLDSEFRSTYEQAFRKRQTQEIEKLKKKQELQRDAYERLGTFSKGAMKLGKELYESHKKERQAYGLALVMQTGVTAEELASLKNKEFDLEVEGAANNRIVERLKASGAGPQEIKRIRDLDGWALYGAQKALAMQAKEAWYAFTNSPERRSKKYDVGGGQELSLDDAETAGMSSERANIIGQMKAEFLKPYSNYDVAFAEKYMFPGMREVDNANQIAFSQKLQKQLEVNDRNRRINNINSEIFLKDDNSGFQRLSNMADASGGPLAAQFRREFMSDLQGLAEKGLLSKADLIKIGDQEINFNGKKTTFRELYLSGKGRYSETGRAFATLEQTIRDKDLQESSRKQAELNARKLELENNFLEMASSRKGRPFTLSEINQITQNWKDNTKGAPLPEPMKRVLANLPTGLDSYKQFIVASGRTDLQNLAEIDTLYPDLTTDQRKVVALSNGIDLDTGTKLSKSLFQEQLDIIENAAAQQVGTADLAKPGWKVDQLMQVVKPKFQRELQQRLADPKYKGRTVESIVVELQTQYVEQINNQKDIFAITGTGKDAFFSAVKPLDSSVNNEISKVIDRIAGDDGDPMALFNGKVFGDDLSSPLIQDLAIIENTGKPTPWIIALSEQIQQPWKTIYNSQATLYGFQTLGLLRHEAAQELIGEDVKIYLGKNAAPSNIQQATSQQQRQNGVVGLEVYRPILNLIASEESSNDVELGGYDAMNLGGTNGGHTPIGSTVGTKHFGQPLTSFTVGQIIQMGIDGEIHAAGRYQMTPIFFRDMQQRGWMPPGITKDTLFDENVQDQLAVAYFRRTVQDYDNPNGELVFGLGQRWIGLQKLPPNEIKRVVNKIINDPRYQTPPWQAYEVAPEFEAARQRKYGGSR